jgi:hypothetical protein
MLAIPGVRLSKLLSVSRERDVVVETSLRGDGGMPFRGRAGIIGGSEGAMSRCRCLRAVAQRC